MKNSQDNPSSFDLLCAEAKGYQAGVEAFAQTLAWPSCFTCCHAVIFEDHSVGIVAYVDDCRRDFGRAGGANFSAYQNDPDYDEEYLADDCGCYSPDPKIIGNIW